ncbi:long-chain fatty acid transport protein 4-like isoform X1 [Harmonia axyridis]|uniref:long-chain fatty acid transport protein 4-like isoform X1 n=2 Tax=Harmonia axyridis TaxID=115357 RepID=UPI001E27847E|nr:long-chain fatty acid transport protein 4-like isoform X1 [Harmonia axyridis]
MGDRDLITNGLQKTDKSPDIESGKVVDLDSQPGKESAAATLRSIRNRPVRVLLRRVAVMAVIVAILVCLGAVVWYFMGWMSLVQLILVALIAYLASGKYRWFYVAARTAPRDLRALYRFIRLQLQIKSYARKNLTLADIFRENVKKHPSKTAICFEDQEWDFAKLEEYSNKIANVFKSHGYKKGDVVALFMENKPEYIGVWLGLSKLGVIVPFINTNLRLSTLVHSITIAKSQAVIFGSELSDAISEILDKVESKTALYQVNGGNNNKSSSDQRFKPLDDYLKDSPSSALPTPENLNHHSNLVYIYTSGTTGLPKAAVISNSRYIFIAAAIHWLAGFKNTDRFYTPLPLYHTAGGCMSVGQMIIYGSTLIIRKKFSASSYFTDCQKYKATVAQYIGEMCRYILAVPPKSADKEHSLRMIFGNGLRPQIWVEFVDRFNISNVAEFYGATEGNANIVNIDNTVGAIGFVSRIIPSVYPISIIKVDQNTGEPIRDHRGLCMPCEPNEPGVFIGRIIANNPSRAFLGYVDKKASDKKVVNDVFYHGDKAFLSGDIVVADEFGYLYFKDRTGDTFRWKGENVSTSEVEGVLSNILDYKDVVVYGVEVRNQEGRAGMAAVLDPDDNVDLNTLAEGCRKSLPSYARPIFIRILKKMDMTGTYKLKKVDLQKEGFDPSQTTDNIYYLDSSGFYSLLTKDIYNKIDSGSIRV